MKNDGKDTNVTGLRRNAEERLAKQGSYPKDDDPLKLIHELQVHQIELEMQNEELMQARAEIEAGLEKYSVLFDFAPVGYFTLTDDGTIQEVNLTGASLLGDERSHLIKQHFSIFLSDEAHPVFVEFLRRVFADTTKKTCEVMLSGNKDNPRHIHIEGSAVKAGKDMGWQCLIAVMDITERKRTEEALRESEERFRRMFEHHKAVMLLIDPQTGFITDANGAAIENYGYSREQLLAMRIQDINQLSPEEVAAEQQKALVQERNYFVFPHRLADGRTRWVEVYSSPFESHGKSLLFSVIHDITDRKSIEEENRMLAAIVESSDEAIIGKTLEGVIKSWNRGAEGIYGYTKDEIIGKSMSVLVPPGHEDDIINILERVRKGEHIEHYETLRLRKDNKPIHVSLSVSPIHDAEGRIIGASTIGRDITERKNMEESLRKSEERFRSLIQKSLDLIVIIDQNDRITYETPSVEYILGYPRGYTIGKSPLDFIHPDDLGMVANDLSEVHQKASPGITPKFRFRRADGTWVHLEAIGQNLIDYPGINGIVITARDITERKRAEAEKERLEIQLAQTQKIETIGTFAGGIAHDFNNILAAIIGYAELAMIDVNKPDLDKVRNNLAGVLRAGKRAKDLVSQILSFSRHDEMEYRPIMLYSTIKESLRMLRSIIPSSIEIRQNLHSSGMVMADPIQIHQLMMNLCSNAAQAIGKTEGVVNVSLKEVTVDETAAIQGLVLHPGPYVRLTLSDTGHGMTPEVMVRIFEPYFTTKDIGSGSGLGLSVVQGIVKKHKGAILCESEPGKGTTFDIYLPRVEFKKEVEESPAEMTLLTGTERVLFIDDEPVLVDLAKQALESLGYKVTSTTSSTEALELFKRNPDSFDLVITDMTMPDMTGDKLAQRILEARHDISIILCSGYGEHITAEKLQGIGIREYIMKPFVLSDLAKTIRRALDTSQE
jgi:PAS domain S-box-containing protein